MQVGQARCCTACTACSGRVYMTVLGAGGPYLTKAHCNPACDQGKGAIHGRFRCQEREG